MAKREGRVAFGGRIPASLAEKFHASIPTGHDKQHAIEVLVRLWLDMPRAVQAQLLLGEQTDSYYTMVKTTVSQVLKADRRRRK